MKFKLVDGKNILNDINLIKATLDVTPDTIFLLFSEYRLHDYITDLYQNNILNDDHIYKLKICYENKGLKLNVSVGKETPVRITSMSELISSLDGNTPTRIAVDHEETVEGERQGRIDLAFVVQQLIYIGYPIDKIDILLRKEENDADKIKRFTQRVDELLNGCESATVRLKHLKKEVEAQSEDSNKKDRLKDIETALESCYRISKQIAKAKSVELKFAVAASKKTGKSVIVNCFIGEEIAPTSIELATPNTCVYRKSKDDKYHFRFEGKEEVRNFSSRKDIFEAIDKEFRLAQNNKENDFTLPDMNIDYVTNEDNFSSYTIYDTPGPDLAGADHGESARKAMGKCDVAIFAIDYAKFLTIPEVEYLDEVKSVFSSQNKFHSLVFALNKIDTRYTDPNAAKSCIKSVDFIKQRLADIDEDYKDCIVFPSCSLEFFSCLEAEKAGASELKVTVPIDDLRKIRNSHRDIKALQWLNTHADNLNYYHGFEEISYDAFKKDSGLPALMSYVSYVAQSKARDEIVNGVTYAIDKQNKKLQNIIDYVENLEKFIQMGDDKIKEISRIINTYRDEASRVLIPSITNEEMNSLGTMSVLRRYNGVYSDFIQSQEKALTDSIDSNVIAEQIYDRFVNDLYDEIVSCANLTNNGVKQIYNNINFSYVINKVLRRKAEQFVGGTFNQVELVNSELVKIIEERQNKLRTITEECKGELAKENVDISLPELPDFKPATPKPPIDAMAIPEVDINFDMTDELKKAIDVDVWKFITEWDILTIFNFKDPLGKIHVKIKDKAQFRKICDEKLKAVCKLAIHENHVSEKINEELNKYIIKAYLQKTIEELDFFFTSTNRDYLNCVEKFSASVDDRKKFKENIDNYNKHKEAITKIVDATNEFMSIWNEIIKKMK